MARLIEEWLPVAALGIESLRERTPMTPFPAPNRLHVWWARRPLVASRAAVLASLLPADADRDKFMHMLGIHGDPVAAREAMAKVKCKDDRIANPYGYSRAFTYTPSRSEISWFHSEMSRAGIEGLGACLDPTAGGGSIPFESLRLGLNTFGNDLNPVAALVEKLTCEAPYLYGREALVTYDKIAAKWRERMEVKLAELFPQLRGPDQIDTTYLFARTIRCPHCNGLIPLSPNWRLAPDGIGVRLKPRSTRNGEDRVCDFEIVYKASEQSPGTVSGGDAVCPFRGCERTVEGNKIKQIAQAGEMGEQLYAIVYKRRQDTILKSGKKGKPKWIRGYRAPETTDDVFADIEAKLAEKMPEWEAADLVPNEAIPKGFKTREPLNFGISLWRDMFSPRQLYCHVTSVEVFNELLSEARQKPDFGEAQKAAFGYLALALDKLLNYNCRSTRWIDRRSVIAGSFDRHDFAFKWSYAELAALDAGSGYDWAIASIEEAITELIKLLAPESGNLLTSEPGEKPKIVLSCGSASALSDIADHSIDAVVMDPPYYDNVMYAELSDFFYVWLKRTAGQIWPKLFRGQLTDKHSEAVANPALHGSKNAAQEAYRAAMADIFAEARRCLKPDGVLTVMFAHKAAGAWNALAKGLMEAGFAIAASWPVSSEAEGSLHIREKAAAKTNIFLVCRPAAPAAYPLFWEEIESEVRRATEARAESFSRQGIKGIDLYLACYGPALSLFSQHWPVQRENGAPVAPEEALAAAGRAVRQWRLAKLVDRRSGFDRLLDWYLLAWDAFGAPVFPYDEANNLARVCGLDMEKDVVNVLGQKKGQDFILWDAATRQAKCRLGTGKSGLLDDLHRLCAIAKTSGLSAAQGYLASEKLARKPDFGLALAAVCQVLPKGSDDGANLRDLLRLLSEQPRLSQVGLLDG